MSRHNPTQMRQLQDSLSRYEREQFPLPGIRGIQDRDVFIKQVIDSIRRVNFVSVIGARDLSANRANPQSSAFDPIRAALIHKNAGRIDEACWLIFLSVHFGRHLRAEWRFVQEVYGKLGQLPHWTWDEITAAPESFRDWLRANQEELMRGSHRGFGNHRKYVSMDADKPVGTGAAILSYVDWVMAYGGHRQLIQHANLQGQGNPKNSFHWLYREMNTVISFARMGKFDYLTMLGKAGLAQVEPGYAYLAGSTGPKKGARFMLQGSLANDLSSKVMEERLIALGRYLGVGMQVIEDSLCNWQKSPGRYRLFAG